MSPNILAAGLDDMVGRPVCVRPDICGEWPGGLRGTVRVAYVSPIAEQGVDWFVSWNRPKPQSRVMLTLQMENGDYMDVPIFAIAEWGQR